MRGLPRRPRRAIPESPGLSVRKREPGAGLREVSRRRLAPVHGLAPRGGARRGHSERARLPLLPPEPRDLRSRAARGRAQARAGEALPLLSPRQSRRPCRGIPVGEVHRGVREERPRLRGPLRQGSGGDLCRLPRQSRDEDGDGPGVPHGQGAHPRNVRPLPWRDRAGVLGERARPGAPGREGGGSGLHRLPRRARHLRARRSALPHGACERLGPGLHALSRLAQALGEVRRSRGPHEELRGQLSRSGRPRRVDRGGELRELPRLAPHPALERSELHRQPGEPSAHLRQVSSRRQRAVRAGVRPRDDREGRRAGPLLDRHSVRRDDRLHRGRHVPPQPARFSPQVPEEPARTIASGPSRREIPHASTSG